MGFLIKIIIFCAISAVIFTKAIEFKQVNESNAAGMPHEVAMLTGAFKAGLNFINPGQPPKPAPEKTIIKRVCKILPNGEEECKNIPPQ